MLLPDNINPELSIYYNGALVLKLLQVNPKQDIMQLYSDAKGKYKMPFPIMVLSLDWLYLIDLIKFNDRREIELCT